MFTFIRNSIKNTMTRKMALLAATAAGLVSMAPMSAMARDRDHVSFDIRIGDRPSRHWVPGACEDRVVQVWVEPCYRTVCDQVFQAPEVRTVCERVWREPVVQTTCERVWVPERYEIRERTCSDGYRTIIRRERILVCEGHFDKIERQVVVCEGHFENVEHQEVVREGGYRRVERQELVTPGHYETRTQRVEIAPGHFEVCDRGGVDIRFHD